MRSAARCGMSHERMVPLRGCPVEPLRGSSGRSARTIAADLVDPLHDLSGGDQMPEDRVVDVPETRGGEFRGTNRG
jgi:hypothetical protein